MQHKLIGIVGGMGPQAGVALHEEIIRNTPTENDQDHLSVVLMTFPGEMDDRTAFLEGKAKQNPAFGILKVIEKLVGLGAQVAGIACNTAHAPEIFGPIAQKVRDSHKGFTLVHLPSEVIRDIQQNHPGSKRIGLMATNGTYNAGIYQEMLLQNGYEVVVPEFAFQDQVIHEMIYNPETGIKARSVQITDEAVALWHKALAFFKDQQVDAVILGCTELPLICKHSPDTELVFIDSTAVLARALIREATGIFKGYGED